jgi:hypothetical protein
VTIYLGGGIHGLSDADAMNWRAYAKARLDPRCRILDPMDRDYRGHELANPALVVEPDKLEITTSNLLLVNYPRPSTGTDMEIYYAWTLHKGIWVVVPGDGRPLSPWLVYHASCTSQDLEWTIDIINQRYEYQHAG